MDVFEDLQVLQRALSIKEDELARLAERVSELENQRDLTRRAFELGVRDARKQALQDASDLCIRVRCRVWSPEECALAIRTMDHPLDCSCHRWVDCGLPP